MAGRDNMEAFEGLHAAMELLGPAIRTFSEIEKVMLREVETATNVIHQELNNLLKSGPEAFVNGVRGKLADSYRKMQQDLNVLEDYGKTDLAREISNGYDALQNKVQAICSNPSKMDLAEFVEVVKGIAHLQQMQKELRKDNTEFMKDLNPKAYEFTRDKINTLVKESPLKMSLNRVNGLADPPAASKAGTLDARFDAAKKEAKLFNASRPAEMIQKGIQQAAQSMDRVLAK